MTPAVWGDAEFPSLTRNPFIREIYRVDPRSVEIGGPVNSCKELIWSRDPEGAVLELSESCEEYEHLHRDNPNHILPGEIV